MAKEHNSIFTKAYNTRWAGYFYCGASISRLGFGRHRTDSLPVTTTMRFVDVTNDEGSVTMKFALYPSNEKGCRKHRVFTVCVKCGREVPVGRIHQHKC